jgi:hypothetical protein
MVDFLTIIAENSEVILLVISILLALVARYFQNQASAIAEAVQAVTELSQTVLDAVKDGVVSKDELDTIVAKIELAKKEIQDIVDIFLPPPTITEKLASVFVGYRRKPLQGAINRAQNTVQQISLMKKMR